MAKQLVLSHDGLYHTTLLKAITVQFLKLLGYNEAT